ncbi:SDR family NAD(P)-dependent oxidoreductase [Desulfatiglans anilini]|uniref:SDR family NAD(P)-dependent oxidoreductase n=1 Tax=Desulfatiglans anilini TaxID=90728 RepID=UPI0003F5B50B|nr:SDR family oxidoreductase [Desulfatiglans anilini]
MPTTKQLFDLSGKTALVTGASSGFGRSFALTLAEAGADVVISARNPERLTETEDLLKATGRRVLKIFGDMSVPEDVSRMIDEAVSVFGHLDIAVNNAGLLTRPVRFHEMTLEDWNQVISVNLTGVFLCMQQEIGRMLHQQAGGSIINISSVLGLVGLDADLNPRVNYIASKHGVIGLTRQAAVEYADRGIRVNAMAPAWHSGTSLAKARSDIQTEQEQAEREMRMLARTPMKRRGRLEELQGMLLFLASDASTYTTGQVFASDGGWTAH